MYIFKKRLWIILLLSASGLAAAILLYLGPQKSGNSNEIQLYWDNEGMEKEVLRHIPLGSDVKKAEQIMQLNGFDCNLLIDDKDCEGCSLSYTNKKTRLLCLKKINVYPVKFSTVQIDFKSNKITRITANVEDQ